MLFILFQQIIWYKKDRTPQGAVIRRQYLKPGSVLEVPVDPDKDEVILWARFLTQDGNQMQEKTRIYKSPLDKGQLLLKKKFMDEVANNLEIRKEGDSYRILWLETCCGRVIRRGGDEDFPGNWQRLIREDPGLLHETAFVLKKDESGIMRWNNRFTSYSGQFYCQYEAYIVHTDTEKTDLFLRDYDYTYEQLADLF